MSLENADFIQDLNDQNPTGTDAIAEGDNHLRMIKRCLLNSLAGLQGVLDWNNEIKANDATDPRGLVTLQQAMNLALPIGMPLDWLYDQNPPALFPQYAGMQFADLDGRLLSRVDYAELFAVMGVTYGAGDGSTTFKLPDYRGRFERIKANGSGQDPNRNQRTNRGDGTAGDAVGTKQADAIRNISGALEMYGYSADASLIFSTTGVFSTSNIGDRGRKINSDTNTRNAFRYTFNAATQVPTGGDNRPTNIYKRKLIRIK